MVATVIYIIFGSSLPPEVAAKQLRASSDHRTLTMPMTHYTGHSMGAGTAALVTTMLRETVPECAEARCYAMACPACMTLELADACREYVTSLINGTDIVPTFSAGVRVAQWPLAVGGWHVGWTASFGGRGKNDLPQ